MAAFSCETLPLPLLRALGESLAGQRRAAPQAPRRRYGARPSDDFVRDAWPIPRAIWSHPLPHEVPR